MMWIGELAAASGVSRATLRFYERQGLIHPRRQGNGYRWYPADSVQRVRDIRTAQLLGFSLAEIGRQLPLIWRSPQPEHAIAEALSAKLEEINTRIDALHALRQQVHQHLLLVERNKHVQP